MRLRADYPSAAAVIPAIEIDRFPFVIGRQRDCDCRLPFAFISRRHCLFTRSHDQVWVQDLESHNGTFVNGRKVTKPVPIRHGDEVSLGPVVLRVDLPCPMEETGEEFLVGTKEEPSLAVGAR